LFNISSTILLCVLASLRWQTTVKILLNESYGHADLYAKALKMYLQYDTVEQWHRHWYDQ